MGMSGSVERGLPFPHFLKCETADRAEMVLTPGPKIQGLYRFAILSEPISRLLEEQV